MLLELLRSQRATLALKWHGIWSAHRSAHHRRSIRNPRLAAHRTWSLWYRGRHRTDQGPTAHPIDRWTLVTLRPAGGIKPTKIAERGWCVGDGAARRWAGQGRDDGHRRLRDGRGHRDSRELVPCVEAGSRTTFRDLPRTMMVRQRPGNAMSPALGLNPGFRACSVVCVRPTPRTLGDPGTSGLAQPFWWAMPVTWRKFREVVGGFEG
jgi:hypothetical protein